MEEVLQPVMFDIPSRDDVDRVVVTKAVVDDNVAPTLVPKDQTATGRSASRRKSA